MASVNSGLEWRELMSVEQAAAVKVMERKGWCVDQLEDGDVLMIHINGDRTSPFVRVGRDGYAQPFHRGRRIGYLWGVATPCSKVAV